MKSSRYLIGIDLGTTNSVVAYVNPQDEAEIRVFDVPQLAGPGEVRAVPALPSFLYFPTEAELSGGAVSLPWDAQPPWVAGVMAREQGALVPGRQVASAKSWLSHAAVDRRARILPADAEPSAALVSPVEASARYLVHLRNAWNHVMSDGAAERAFEKQEIVLTVPASFDEEARELTVEAARQAGLEDFTLVEEPLAAFYSWIAAHRERLPQELRDGELVLICDIGGGTTDFSLVRVHIAGDDVQFERTAIGEHLLLGGDNLDLALARVVERRLGARLSLRQRLALRRACCAAKERLLGDPMLERAPINVLGSGRAVVGQMLSTELRRAEVVELLISGFLPLTAASDRPSRARATGLRELGLPYAGDAAITKHLAAFLAQAATAMEAGTARGRMVRPDAILFNGGFCNPTLTRERIAEAVSHWFSEPGQEWRPRILPHAALESAVARGAAYYGRVRRGAGLRIRAGSARSYYIGLRSEQGVQGVCVLPFGVEEGTTLPLDNRDFAVLANRPVSFTLYSSRTRHDAHGAVATLDEGEIHRHAPLVTLLRYGKKLRELELAVRLRVSFTELGTLELWCESLSSPHRWRLQFELRGQQQQPEAQLPAQAVRPAPPSTVAEPAVEAAVRSLRAAFGKPVEAAEAIAPETLVAALESTLAKKRDAWPVEVIRRFAEVLAETAEGRNRSSQHEVRWLNLLGFCLRPGFGAPGDDARMNLVRKISASGVAFPREVQNEVQWLVFWRRLAGGLHASQQQQIYREQVPLLGITGAKKKLRLNPQVEYEAWRLLAALEHLPPKVRASLGQRLVARITQAPEDTRWLWPLARIGARIPLYGPLHSVVPAATVAAWLDALLALRELTEETANCIVQLARRTGDAQRDLDDAVRKRAIGTLPAVGVAEESIQALQKYLPPERSDAERMFGESLPRGLRLVSSANCLLAITALTPDPEKVA